MLVSGRLACVCALILSVAEPAMAQEQTATSSRLDDASFTLPPSASFRASFAGAAAALPEFPVTNTLAISARAWPAPQSPPIAAVLEDMKEMLNREIIAIEMMRQGYPSDAIWGFLATGRIPLNSLSSKKDLGFFDRQAQSSSTDRGSGLSTISVVASFGLGKADFSHALEFLGGARYDRVLTPRVAFYAQVEAGITHFTGESDFTIIPGGGIEFLLSNKKYLLTAGIGIPIISFGGGGHENGFQIQGGLAIPIH
jgi:hypothetical protein